jgi:hypothetical protein
LLFGLLGVMKYVAAVPRFGLLLHEKYAQIGGYSVQGGIDAKT